MQLLNLIDLMTIYPDLFDTFTVPEGCNRDDIVNAILFRSGRSYPLYQDPVVFQNMLNILMHQIAPTAARLQETTQYDYDPIENYNRYEEGVRHNVNINTSQATVEGTTESATEATTIGNQNDTNTHDVSAYDSSTYTADSKDTLSGHTDTTVNTSDNGKQSSLQTGSGSNTGDEHYENHMHGNIGVTTTQQMIQQERDIALFNIYQWIAVEVDVKLFYGLYNTVR